MFWHSLKLALRNILKHRQSYTLNIAGLIIAFVVCFLTLFYVVFENNHQQYRFQDNNIYFISETDTKWDWPSEDIPLGLSDYLSDNTPAISKVVKYKENSDFHIKVDDKSVFKEWSFHFVDSNYMNIINKTTLAGNCLLKNKNDILLTKATALKYFGSTECIGKQLAAFGEDENIINFTVSGVFEYPAAREFRAKYNIIARLDIYNQLKPDFDFYNAKENIDAYLILNKNADIDNIVSHIKIYYTSNINPDYCENKRIELITPQQRHIEYVGKRMNNAVIIASIILIIALINFIIHNNAQFWERSKTIGINKIVGSKTKHVLIHSFSESLTINLLSISIAFAIALLILPYTKKYLNETLTIDSLPIVKLFIYGIAASILISILTSISSLFLSNRKPLKLVSKQVNKAEKGKFINSALITSQIGVTAFLMILFLTTTRQIKYVENIDWGFNSEQLMYVRLHNNVTSERFSDFKNRLQNIPNIVSMSGCWHVPPAGDKFFIGYFNEYGEKIMIDRNGVDYSYLETMGIKLKSGRDFNMNIDKPGSKLIVNQEYLDVKNITNPYDTLLKTDDRYAAKQIIGVIDDYHMRGMHEKITPQLLELDPNESRNLIVKISPKNVATTLKQIEEQYSQIFPNKAYSMGFVDDDIQNLYENQKNYNKLISYYTIISLIIACMGLFGFVISEMNKRIKEIGIRKVNGAKVIELFNFLNKEFIMLCIAGFIISSPLALYFSKEWIKNFAYKIAPAWWILAIVLLTIILIVFATVSIQTVRVARKNPVEALRYE